MTLITKKVEYVSCLINPELGHVTCESQWEVDEVKSGEFGAEALRGIVSSHPPVIFASCHEKS